MCAIRSFGPNSFASLWMKFHHLEVEKAHNDHELYTAPGRRFLCLGCLQAAKMLDDKEVSDLVLWVSCTRCMIQIVNAALQKKHVLHACICSWWAGADIKS
jgi:hypothetical protein